MRQQWRLTKTVTVSGRTIWGHRSTLTLEPHRETSGWVWWTGSEEVSITPALFVSRCFGRTVALCHNNSQLYEFEHVAFFHALGLRGVRVSCTNKWPPYMCSRELWERLQECVVPDGLLEPLRLPETFVESTPSPRLRPGHQFIDDFNRVRKVAYAPDDTKLCFQAHVVYPVGEDARGRGSIVLGAEPGQPLGDLSNIFAVVSSRTLGKPLILRPLVWAISRLGLQHEQKMLWLTEPYGPVCRELALHKLLDMGLFSFVAPDGYHLAGTIYAMKSSHRMDMALLRRLHRT